MEKLTLKLLILSLRISKSFNTTVAAFHQESILGDFNVNVAETTTDYRSLLDHIYISNNIRNYKCSVFESYFSDHKAIHISLH
ncbi:hypothetical protein MAR_032088 [Mya arenaria]|uniref:Uncharacterized protein n=1 Tax=Mya arenaria TaxID=6604 RepID=A0ABY7F9M9_MYAAR|nr:hypothetical protein MAR_032088 [Mya arenaria]